MEIRNQPGLMQATPGHRHDRQDLQWLSDDELKEAVNLQLDEVEHFRKLFEQAAGPGQPVLHGKAAVVYFSRSGLPAAVLKKIWENSDRKRKGHLTRSEFVMAARLVALSQVGMRPTVEQLQAYKSRFPVPKFELPANIYTDDFDVTEAEKAIKHEYDAETCEWKRTLINVILERAPFSEGAMRAAYHMRDLTASGEQSHFVAKMAKPGTHCSAEQYFDDVRMQTEAKKWANEFNKHKVPKRVDFIAAYVIELIDRPARPICGVERFVPGEYVKYNNNWDWSDERRNTPQSFSHFTWEASGHTLLVCDIQGVADMYTDPQIHSIDAKGYGMGNLGMRGIVKFLDSHTCNHICNYLKLPAKRSKNVNTGTVMPHHGAGTRVGATRCSGSGENVFSDKIKDMRANLQDQFQERLRRMEAQAARIMQEKLEAQRQSLFRQHHARQLAIDKQREILEAEKRRLEEEKARWLDQERQKLGQQMDQRYEEERVRLSREAMGEMVIGGMPKGHDGQPVQNQHQAQPQVLAPARLHSAGSSGSSSGMNSNHNDATPCSDMANNKRPSPAQAQSGITPANQHTPIGKKAPPGGKGAMSEAGPAPDLHTEDPAQLGMADAQGGAISSAQVHDGTLAGAVQKEAAVQGGVGQKSSGCDEVHGPLGGVNANKPPAHRPPQIPAYAPEKLQSQHAHRNHGQQQQHLKENQFQQRLQHFGQQQQQQGAHAKKEQVPGRQDCPGNAFQHGGVQGGSPRIPQKHAAEMQNSPRAPNIPGQQRGPLSGTPILQSPQKQSPDLGQHNAQHWQQNIPPLVSPAHEVKVSLLGDDCARENINTMLEDLMGLGPSNSKPPQAGNAKGDCFPHWVQFQPEEQTVMMHELAGMMGGGGREVTRSAHHWELGQRGNDPMHDLVQGLMNGAGQKGIPGANLDGVIGGADEQVRGLIMQGLIVGGMGGSNAHFGGVNARSGAQGVLLDASPVKGGSAAPLGVAPAAGGAGAQSEDTIFGQRHVMEDGSCSNQNKQNGGSQNGFVPHVDARVVLESSRKSSASDAEGGRTPVAGEENASDVGKLKNSLRDKAFLELDILRSR